MCWINIDLLATTITISDITILVKLSRPHFMTCRTYCPCPCTSLLICRTFVLLTLILIYQSTITISHTHIIFNCFWMKFSALYAVIFAVIVNFCELFLFIILYILSRVEFEFGKILSICIMQFWYVFHNLFLKFTNFC